MREFKTTAFLMAFCLVLYGFLAVYDDHEQPDLEGPQRPILMEKSDLVEIEITRQDDQGQPESYVLRRQQIPQIKGSTAPKRGEGWIVQSGNTAYLTDEGNVDQLLQRLSEFEVKRTLEVEGKDLAEFGLDKPQAKIRWSAPSARTASMREGFFEIGGRSPVGSLLFTRLNGKLPVYAAESWRLNSFTKEPAHFRDRQVLHDLEEEELESIRIANLREGEEHTFRRESDERWTVLTRTSYEADPAQIAQLLSDLKSLRAQQFLSADPGKLQTYGFERPQLVIKFSMRNGLTSDLKVGNIDPDRTQRVRVLASNSLQPVSVEGDLLRRAFAPPDEYRIKAILKGRFEEIERFTLRSHGQTYAYAKLGGPWKLESVPEADVNDSVRRTLEELERVSVNRFVEDSRDPASFGLFEAPFLITIPAGSSGEREYRLRLSAGAEEKGHFLFQEGDPTVYRASSKKYYQLVGELAQQAEDLVRATASAKNTTVTTEG